MITKDELREQAKVYELNDADVQRDYVFGWLISSIFQATNLGEHAVLKGGNALRKGYFPGTRFSDDLDFSTAQGLHSEHVLEQLNEACRFAESASAIRFDLDRNRVTDVHQIDRDRQVFKFRIYFKDMLADRDHVDISVRMDVTEYDRLYLPPQESSSSARRPPSRAAISAVVPRSSTSLRRLGRSLGGVFELCLVRATLFYLVSCESSTSYVSQAGRTGLEIWPTTTR